MSSSVASASGGSTVLASSNPGALRMRSATAFTRSALPATLPATRS